MKSLYFDFYQCAVNVQIDSPESAEIEKRLVRDFRFFNVPDLSQKVKYLFHLKINFGAIPIGAIPDHLTSIAQSANSITYQKKKVRYNDYYGEALSIFNYSNESAELWSPSLDRLHEIAYLLILSRVGKWHDRHHLFRIHAFGIRKYNQTLVCMMPMKGGKTTLFTSLIQDASCELISDDTPLCNLKGEIFPFPIRMGLEDRSAEWLSQLPADAIYSINRKQYGQKTLIDLTQLPNAMASVSPSQILMQGIRITGTESKIVPCNPFIFFKYLVKNMVIGVGLPMILEYFLEATPLDWLRQANILCRRTWAALHLLVQSQCVIAYLGTDRIKNHQMIDEWLKKHES